MPGGPAPQGHGEPKPRAEGTGAHQQPRRCPAAPGRAACSAEPAACFCSPEDFAGGFEGGRRPPAARPQPPPLRPLDPPPPRLLQKGARTHRQAPGKAPGARLQDRAIGGAGRLPFSPQLPPPLRLLPSLPRSLAPSLSLRSPPPLTERLPYKIYESALSSRCRALSYSQGSGAELRGGASQGVFAAPASGDDPLPASVQVPDPAPGPVVGPPENPFRAPWASRSSHPQPHPRPLALPGWRSETRLASCVLPTGWEARTAAQSAPTAPHPDYMSAPLSISSMAGSASSSEARRLPLAQDSSRRSSASHPESQDTVPLGGGLVCPRVV